jgi:hypothetical protein
MAPAMEMVDAKWQAKERIAAQQLVIQRETLLPPPPAMGMVCVKHPLPTTVMSIHARLMVVKSPAQQT